MSKLFLILLTAAGLIGLPASAAMDNATYKATKKEIQTTYKSDKAACASLTGNAKDVCMAEAKAKRKVARAEAAAAHGRPWTAEVRRRVVCSAKPRRFRRSTVRRRQPEAASTGPR